MSALYNAKYHTSFLENKIGMSCIPRLVLSASWQGDAPIWDINVVNSKFWFQILESRIGWFDFFGDRCSSDWTHHKFSHLTVSLVNNWCDQNHFIIVSMEVKKTNYLIEESLNHPENNSVQFALVWLTGYFVNIELQNYLQLIELLNFIGFTSSIIGDKYIY